MIEKNEKVQEVYKEWRKQNDVSSDPRGNWPLRFAVYYHELMMSESPAPATPPLDPCTAQLQADWDAKKLEFERVAAPEK